MEGGGTETESIKNEGNQLRSDDVHQETEDQSTSPRGVLEIPISGGSDSDGLSSECGGDLLPPEAGEFDFNLGNLQWKKMLGQMMKKKPVRRFSAIPLLPFAGMYATAADISKKCPKRKTVRTHSADEALDCGDFVMPKPSWKNFTYDELKQATHGFSPDKMIGKGGHAEVYRGTLPDGQIVAVKRILKQEKKTEDRVGDFLSELGIIAHIDHPNAAKLIGFSADRGLYLVLQFSPHGSLATVLHGSGESLEWEKRYKVAIGIAEGLEYLHYYCQRRIVHRDITASNILLSEDYEAEISDFGLAKWLPDKWGHHVVSPIEGTFGYMAPEYFMHGVVHEKTDVFAFGVLLLELITGRRAVDSSSQSLAIWAKPFLEKNNVAEIADPRLGNNYDIFELKRAMYTASTCIHHSPNMRPTMQRAVKLLKGENALIDLKQQSMGGNSLLFDACDLEGYTSTTYLKDLNRHMELVME